MSVSKLSYFTIFLVAPMRDSAVGFALSSALPHSGGYLYCFAEPSAHRLGGPPPVSCCLALTEPHTAAWPSQCLVK